MSREDLDSSNSYSDKEETHIGLMADTTYNSTSNNFDLHSVKLAYYEVISNTSRIAQAFKFTKKNFQSAYKEIETLNKTTASFDDVFKENVKLVQTNKVLCEENKGMKQNLERQNIKFEKIST